MEASLIVLMVLICSGFLGSLVVIVVVDRIERPQLQEAARRQKPNRSTYCRCFVAFMLGLTLVGLGQFYNRQILKGVMFLICTFCAWFFLAGWYIALIAIVDAVYVAYKLRDSPWTPQVVGECAPTSACEHTQ